VNSDNGAAIETEGLEFSYIDGTKALANVSIRIPAGKKVAFLGPNGAGKTTLFLHFNGLVKPDRGKVYVAGKEVRYDRASLLEVRKKVGIVFQDPDTQLFSSSVKQEISFGPLNLGLSREATEQRVRQAMEDTGILDLQDKPTHFLSYGQKKRVAIADILAMQPQVLVCDEPTAWLDVKHSRQIMEILDRCNARGVTVIISTHDVDMAYAWSDYIFVMKDGQVISEGVPLEIFADREVLQEAELDEPLLFKLSKELAGKGCLKEAAPAKSVEELIGRIVNMDYSLANLCKQGKQLCHGKGNNLSIDIEDVECYCKQVKDWFFKSGGDDFMKKGVLVLGHGSRRQAANEELSKLVEMVQAEMGVRTAPAYFQFAKPSLADVVESFVSEGIEEIIIVPALLFPGIHLMEDIPQALEELKLKYGEKVNFHLTPALGADPRLAEIIMERVQSAEKNLLQDRD
jgi:cobalt transport protein ATP-binding subunit